MTTVDSGNETLVSDDSPCELIGGGEGLSPPSGNGPMYAHHVAPGGHARGALPPKIQPYSGVLGQGKVVIRPIAFRPVGSALGSAHGQGRFSNLGERYGSTPILASRPGSQGTTYGSSSDLRHSHNNYSLDRKLLSACTSASSSPPLAMASLSSLPLSSERKLSNYDSLESVRRSPASISNSQMATNKSTYRIRCGGGGSLLDLTPSPSSPSDSGISELEAALRERDSELAYLRQTMEHNEQVIFRVYQDKERVWERELRRMKSLHDNRLRANAQKTLKLEQMLMMQTYQLQQDKKRMSSETEDLREELELLRGRLEDTEWSLCQKSGEISLLKTQLKDSQNEQTTKDHEILQLRGDLRDALEMSNLCEKQVKTLQKMTEERASEVKRLEKEIQNLTSTNDSSIDTKHANEVARLQEEIRELREELSEVAMSEYEGIECGRSLRGIYDTCKTNSDPKWPTGSEDPVIEKVSLSPVTDSDHRCCEVERLAQELESKRTDFEKERKKWAEEKEKVLKYQRQLQLNYVQMFRKTRSLETELEELTLELEIRSKKNQLNQSDTLGQTIEL